MRFKLPLVVLLLAVGTMWAGAQGILYPSPEVREIPFLVKNVQVNSVITDGVAETTVEQVFVNNSAIAREGTYLFPLPEGAGVTSFSLKAEDRVLEGRVLGKDEARSVYESIVRKRRDPALLEYVGRGLFRASVFPIPPHGERTLVLRYAEVLKTEGDLRKYTYPLSTGRFYPRPLETSSITVKLKTAAPLKTVYSPTNDVFVRRTDDYTAVASWESRQDYPDGDFTLYYATNADEVGLSLLTYRGFGRDSYFMLIASPRYNVPKERILPKQIVFLLDRTGSMASNKKIEQARNSLKYCLDRLNPSDRFDVVTFNESPDVLYRSLQPATESIVSKAQSFIADVEASGGTNIDEALKTALSLLKEEPGNQKMIVFLTDGQPTVGETNVDVIMSHVRNINGGSKLASIDKEISKEAAGVKARIFCFGVGYDVNAPFLDRLAVENRADADYVRPQENIESVVSSFYSKVASPILSDLNLTFAGVDTYDVYPREMPDLFKGGQLIITGRFRGDNPGTVRLTGTAMGRQETFTLANGFSERSARSSVVPRIWAMRKIGYLLDQVRLNSNQEVIDEIIRLSKDYGIVTPYTSYLADERQDTVMQPIHQDGAFYYKEDPSVMNRLRASTGTVLQNGGAAQTGQDAAYSSMNAGGYKQANRAPTSAQGGLGGGGGFGANGFDRRSAGYGGRSGLSLDYGRAVDLLNDAKSDIPGYRQIQQSARMQSVGGRVFYLRNNVWFDNDYKSEEKVIRVKALSDAHFQLLHALPSLNSYAAVGDEVLLNVGKLAVQIGSEGKESLTDAEVKEIIGK